MARRLLPLLAAALVSAGLLSAGRVAALTPPPPPAPVLVQFPGSSTPTLLGAFGQGGWVQGETAARLVSSTEVYRVQGLSGPARVVRGGQARSFDDPCPQTFGVDLSPALQPSTFRVATVEGLRSRPRPVQSLPTGSPVYGAAVKAELLRRGLKNPRVRVRSVIRADLDGNGTDEVIVEASHFAGRNDLFPPPTGQPGDYSLLLLRSVERGKVRTTVLGAYVALKAYDPASGADMPLAGRYALAGLADLNGDGRLEIITFGAYYEGYGLTAQEWTPGGGLKTRLETGCGT